MRNRLALLQSGHRDSFARHRYNERRWHSPASAHLDADFEYRWCATRMSHSLELLPKWVTAFALFFEQIASFSTED